jgi:hypothetical protein
MFNLSRHIPEEELHAYLDQALSRSQCVEIESHLATCAPCRSTRDDIAALRDRTTALLSTLAPPAIHTPPFSELQELHLERSARRQRIIRFSAWAASIIVALGFGWSARAFSPGTPDPVATGAAAPMETVAEAPAPQTPPQAAAPTVVDHSRPVPSDADTGTPSETLVAAEPMPNQVATEPPVETPAVPVDDRFPTSLADGVFSDRPAMEITSSTIIPDDELTTFGVWRSLSWDGAREHSVDDWIPRVSGLPVVDVQVRESVEEDSKPLMVVSQRLSSGEVIRTLSGPADEITDLLARQSGQSITATLQILDNEDSLAVGDSLMRQATRDDRVLAIQGSIPVDSLRTLLLRLR